MASATSERLISAGLELFTQHGFAQVGLDSILQRAELTKTTFYNHFESKESLMRVVIERYLQKRIGELRQFLEQNGNAARGQLMAVFDFLDRLHDRGDLYGSLLINALVEFPMPNDPIHLTALDCVQGLRQVFHDLASNAGVANPKQFTDQFMIVFSGVILNYKMDQSSAPMNNGREIAELMLSAEA